jgi:hypothetical protein
MWIQYENNLFSCCPLWKLLLKSQNYAVSHSIVHKERNIIRTASDISFCAWESPWSHMAHIKSIFMSQACNSQVQSLWNQIPIILRSWIRYLFALCILLFSSTNHFLQPGPRPPKRKTGPSWPWIGQVKRKKIV